MLDTELRLYAFQLGYLQKMMADVGDDELAHQPSPGVNPPLWILGHLAIATDGALKGLGQPPHCPPAWSKMFGMGSSCDDVPQPHPTKDELLSAIATGHELVTAAVRQADPQLFEHPHGRAMFENTPLKTLGDTLALLLTTHEATHLGQLSSWRRQTGRNPLF